jgi:tetratricopeptide (TPR) repeat protein
LGPDHPSTLTSAHSLAVILQSRGQLVDAEALYRRAVQGQATVLGDHHPDTLTSYHNLAGCLRAQGKLAEAELYYRRDLQGSAETRLGAHSQASMATSYLNLAGLMRKSGRMAEAEVMVLSALQDLQDYDRNEPNGDYDDTGEEGVRASQHLAARAAFSMAKQTSAIKADVDSARRVLSSFRSNSIGRLP